MAERLDILSLRPGDTPAYMTAAWLGCVAHCANDLYIIRLFERAGGDMNSDLQINSEGSIDVDGNAVTRKFIEWVNVNIWGPI